MIETEYGLIVERHKEKWMSKVAGETPVGKTPEMKDRKVHPESNADVLTDKADAINASKEASKTVYASLNLGHRRED